ncbi:hypothetical protein ACFL17_09190, partial [Pseudomonadota bacterium]
MIRINPKIKIVGSFLGLVAVLIAIVLLGRVFLVEGAIKFYLEKKGLVPTSLSVDGIGFGRANISGLTVGPDSEFYIEGIEVDYDLLALIGGKVKSVRVNNGKFTAQVYGDELDFGVFDNLISNSPSTGVPDQVEEAVKT